MGLSPRGRGKQRLTHCQFITQGSIPAWAGETHWVRADEPEKRVYPRVGGGNRNRPADRRKALGLSPRGRGKRWQGDHPDDKSGSIPAWAGETAGRASLMSARSVYPRVGGGNCRPLSVRAVLGGLSPRGRGKRALLRPSNFGSRSIPAWAGET